MGVYRYERRRNNWRSCCPHACGGVPTNSFIRDLRLPLSPRMWGCTGIRNKSIKIKKIVPTHVGVYRCSWKEKNIYKSCPHACGGVPLDKSINNKTPMLSPRMWGCTGKGFSIVVVIEVVPTHVEVYRRYIIPNNTSYCCPHACGGVPLDRKITDSEITLSPRMWGCTE